MNNKESFNSSIEPIPEETETNIIENETDDSEFRREKPEFVKEIESYDTKNLSKEQIDFMINTIQSYFYDHFPVDKEIIDKIPEKMNVLNEKEYDEVCREKATKEEYEISKEATGFYSEEKDKIYINLAIFETPGKLFSTMFHESLHYASINSGGGFNIKKPIIMPLECMDTEEKERLISKSLTTANEGMTQLFTIRSVVEDMGFDFYDDMDSYLPERIVVNAVLKPFDAKTQKHLYFKTSAEEMRQLFETNLEFEKDQWKINAESSNGCFAELLNEMQNTKEEVEKALAPFRMPKRTEEEDRKAREEISEALIPLKHIMGEFMFYQYKNGKREITEEDKEEFKDYLEPFITEEEEND